MSPPVSVGSFHTMLPPDPLKLPIAELFVTNLRLLDLDLRRDWPAISSKTFSTKDSQQNQKQRIRCTEWALYRLFEIWDPEETRDKLQPFFPPLEPLQSLNLRSALYRSLNELKKNGVLGRESILRKTMLDECKGEKLMEVLVLFSTAVIRKVELSSADNRRNGSIARKLATANVLNAVQQGSLTPLAVVHAASIAVALKKKEDRRERYSHFNKLLDGKQVQLQERLNASEVAGDQSTKAGDEAQVKKVLQENWPGNSGWPRAILYGDESEAGDLPLKRSFDEVWAVVSEGGQLQADAASIGLLESLDRRVKRHNERLSRWQAFHGKLTSENAPNTGKTDYAEQGRSANALAFRFDRHKHLHLGQDKSASSDGANSPSLGLPQSAHKYKAILVDAKKEISRASMSRRAGGHGWSMSREGNNTLDDHAIFSPVKPAMPVVSQTRTGGSISNLLRNRTPVLENKPSLPAPAQPTEHQDATSRPKSVRKITPKSGSISKPAMPPPQAKPVTKKNISQQPPKPASPDPPSSSSDEETAAEQIISSIVNAAPSPIKTSGLTLTERTRMSMAQTNVLPESDEPAKVDSAISISAPESKEPVDFGNRRASLLDRTRQSIAAIPSHPIQSKKALNKKAHRHSLFPVNQFETPGKPRPQPDERRDATPTEVLFSEEAEYDSVFKSRPRIALSPVWSPDGSSIVGLDEALDEALDLEEVPEDSWESSPLAKRRLPNGTSA